ncbi:MAG TPA: molybdopterin-dependent oxidoreductase [Bradyrhizobium sp.]|nr:molybdopterin-dependent oxidoreductase [Bradyrhizobium sp.]
MTERRVLSACPHDCPDTCAMLTTVKDGKVVSVRGNPEHPFTRGGLCVKVKKFEERVYHLDRVLYPLRRTGAKGSGAFERISWDAALGEIKQRFQAIIGRHGPQAILPCSYLGHEGMLNGLGCGDAFFNRLGATVAERTFCASGIGAAYQMVLGMSPGLDPESFAHARLILLWGCNVIGNMLHHWPFIAEAKRRGARVVVIDPLRSRTAAAADWHIPIRPGTDTALVLGMIHVIGEEGLLDRDYIERYTTGFDELAARAKEFPPERVEAITAVPKEDIRKLAREFATLQPAAIRVGVAIERSAGGGDALRAIVSLPALVGAWRHVGGGVMASPARAFPRKMLSRPDLIPPGTRVVNLLQLGRALTGRLGLDPPIDALFVYNSNPLIACPEEALVAEGLARDDLFTVVSEQFLTDTALYADLVLPAATQLEQIDLMYSWGHFYLTWNEQAIAPLGEAVSNTELFRRLAAAMGFDDDPLFRRSDEELIRETLDWSAPALSGITMESLRERGYARLNIGLPEERAPHADGSFLTPSGKCELKSSLAERGSFVVPPFRQGHLADQAGTPVAGVPDYVAPRESPLGQAPGAVRYPLSLVTPKSHAFLNSGYANLAVQRHAAGPQCAMLHPDDALARGIGNGETVTVFNDRGRLTCKARVTADVMPGLVAIPSGYWRSASASNTSANVLASAELGNIGRSPTFSDVAVEVRLA